jgi:beta-lactamase class A
MPPVHSPIREQHPRGVSLPLREVLRLAVVESDGAASDALLRLVPPRELTRFVRSLGAEEMVVATTEAEIAGDERAQYRSWSTPVAAVRWLCALQRPGALTTSSRSLLLKWMMETATGPHRIRGMLPPGTPVAHKTGTDRTRNGLTRATNDIGLIALPDGRHLAVAVFIADSRSSEADRERALARIACAAWVHWSGSAVPGPR